ncbi:hypothetical protein BpHYR1_014696 [Brachionus plicatilis]|uniref:Uncharacterized protein n=1 Tax=Brachionus plicatilis TaxID=10195 RepID=A0A3M7RHJ6_BRAPC|nr:hypothetical protein BpHYR1_014696 [Brachionus plicatilis]
MKINFMKRLEKINQSTLTNNAFLASSLVAVKRRFTKTYFIFKNKCKSISNNLFAKSLQNCPYYNGLQFSEDLEMILGEAFFKNVQCFKIINKKTRHHKYCRKLRERF